MSAEDFTNRFNTYLTPDKTFALSHGKGIKGDTRTMVNYEKRF